MEPELLLGMGWLGSGLTERGVEAYAVVGVCSVFILAFVAEEVKDCRVLLILMLVCLLVLSRGGVMLFWCLLWEAMAVRWSWFLGLDVKGRVEV